MKTSQTGIEFITREEGCKLHVYNDSVGLPTIGVGHLIKPGEHFTTITLEQAQGLLRVDLAHAEAAVNGLQADVTQYEFDALVSLAFNIGVTAFSRSTLARKVVQGARVQAAAEFLKWKNAGGKPILLKRRQREKAMYEGKGQQ